MRLLFLFVLIFILSIFSCKEEKSNLLLEQAREEYVNDNYEKAISRLDSLLKIEDDICIVSDALIEKAECLYMIDRDSLAFSILDNVITELERSFLFDFDDRKIQERKRLKEIAHYTISYMYDYHNEHEKVIEHLQKVISKVNGNDSKETLMNEVEKGKAVRLVDSYVLLSSTYERKEEYREVIKYSLEGLDYANKKGLDSMKFDFYPSLIESCIKIEHNDFAADYLVEFIPYQIFQKDTLGLIKSYSQLANIHSKNDELELADAMFQKKLEYSLAKNDTFFVMDSYWDRGWILFRKADYLNAISLLDTAKFYCQEKNFFLEKDLISLAKIDIFLSLDEVRKAEIEETDIESEISDFSLETQLYYHEVYAKLNEKKGNSELALYHHKEKDKIEKENKDIIELSKTIASTEVIIGHILSMQEKEKLTQTIRESEQQNKSLNTQILGFILYLIFALIFLYFIFSKVLSQQFKKHKKFKEKIENERKVKDKIEKKLINEKREKERLEKELKTEKEGKAKKESRLKKKFANKEREVKKVIKKFEREKEEKEEVVEKLERKKKEKEMVVGKLEREKKEKEQIVERLEKEKEEKELVAEKLEREKKEKEQVVEELEKEKEEKEQVVERLGKEKEEKEQIVERLEKEKEEKEQVVQRLEKEKEEKEQVVQRLEKEKEEKEKLIEIIKEKLSKPLIFVEFLNGIEIKFDSISWVTTNYKEKETGLKVHYSHGKTLFVKESIAKLEKNYPFEQIHKQHLINPKYIDVLRKDGVILEGVGELVPFPINESKAIYERLKKILKKRDSFENKL